MDRSPRPLRRLCVEDPSYSVKNMPGSVTGKFCRTGNCWDPTSLGKYKDEGKGVVSDERLSVCVPRTCAWRRSESVELCPCSLGRQPWPAGLSPRSGPLACHRH